ncbi:hypothetical protein L914_02389 [Phytophthora nicotianae]|uniref:UDENN domain-containing protein n=1 Tax=Phytophthora nicotianae TaxID=4792 RepID=W2P0A2_PHYNI|nr:hypothetical protein L914_02389 [Phytophthora nicotianae]
MSDSEEDSSSTSKQKSIFSGMGRVKQINHLREKWSPKPKSPLLDRSFMDTPPSSPWSRRPSPVKYPSEAPSENGRHTFRRSQSVSGSPTRQPAVTIVDMERYLAINTWLERNGINVAQVDTSGAITPEKSKNYGLFDDMYCSLEVLENSLKTDLSHLGISESVKEDSGCRNPSSRALFDYLAVIGTDMLDVKIRNFRSQRENVFEPTVAFAHPPESQFNAESLEHFCFPAGIKLINTRSETSDESANFKEGEFFVLMISGGGIQGQSVQYAMCMKGTIIIPRGSDDGKCLLLPICYCVIAQIPFIPFFRALLQGFLDNIRNELESSADTIPSSSIVTDKHAGFIDDVLQRLKELSLPDKGLSMPVDVFSPSPQLILVRPHKENDLDEKVTLLLQWALPSLLSRLSIDRLLQILSLLLIETKLIVVSDEIPLLSSSTLGLASLLHPLVWAGPLISILPPSMHEYMEAPVPLICGVDELPRDFECCKGTCVLYLMENRVQLHADDERAFRSRQMPGLENLSCDLTRFTKQMLGRVTGSFRDNVTPLSTHLVIHRVRRHIEHLISMCVHTTSGFCRDQVTNHELDASETRFADIFKQTQMYQKYQDDQPITIPIELSTQEVPTLETRNDKIPIKGSSINTQHDELKSATSMLFQIALSGVSIPPPSSSQVESMPTSIVSEEIETPSLDMEASPVEDEPEPRSVALSSTASSTLARIFPSLKLSPNEIVESPAKGCELLSPTLSEASTIERKPDRTFMWPVSHSEFDVFWEPDETSVASPGGSLALHVLSPRSLSFESPCRSPNYTRDATFVADSENAGRSGPGSVMKPHRADTETTISLFDTALSEALGSADAIDETWLFEPPDDPRPNLQQNDASGDERSAHESLTEDDNILVYKESFVKEIGTELNNSPVVARRSRHGSYRNADQSKDDGPRDCILTADQFSVLVTGISVQSRGAWEGWCEGQMFISSDLKTLTWERHAVAFAALNMNIADITRVAFEDQRTASPCGSRQRRVQFTFTSEAIYFQFSISPQHDVFFDIFKQLIPPTQYLVEGQQQSFPPLSSPVVFNDSHCETTTTDITPAPSFLAPLVSEIDLFKQKLQRGFLVEKHGRLGRPHAKLLFTDALCFHIMWRKPPASGMDDQFKLDQIDQMQRRSTLFSQDKSIAVDSITAIVTGKQTAVFRRATASKSNDRVCLSILTPTRTLDICAYSLQGFQELYRGFSLLVQEIKRTRDGLD